MERGLKRADLTRVERCLMENENEDTPVRKRSETGTPDTGRSASAEGLEFVESSSEIMGARRVSEDSLMLVASRLACTLHYEIGGSD